VKIRLVNEMDSDHLITPFHIHGRGGSWCWPATAKSSRTSWSDTVLVRTGETVDILLDVTNPGRWMAHCHIAEHRERHDVQLDVVEAEARRDRCR
jgi:FtsP/CotA-like multicopper oxidase with cupredoxin domain